MFSFTPLRNPIGFGAVDAIVLLAATLLVGLALSWQRWIRPFGLRLAQRPLRCLIVIGAAPILLRLFLLAHHPIPTPDIYDEFGHLLMADTLRHWRLANPPHAMPQFFETFFVLQEPTYSSIYPIGNGLAMAIGWALFGFPWAGVLLATGAFCALCYWMLRGWVSPAWSLAGGVLAVMEFGPLNQWSNNYWGGHVSAAAGCLVFGAVARIREHGRTRDAVLLGIGLAIHILTRPYESIFLIASVLLFFLPRRALIVAGLTVLPAIAITLLQNKRVTGAWTTLPYQLSQYQYGVPAPLTLQESLTPHRALTREQDLDYRMQRAFHPGRDSIGSYFGRLWFRVRYYRFYFYAPLYPALALFLWRARRNPWAWMVGTCLLFALGVNFFPAFQFHYVAAIVCLFVLMSVKGLEWLPREASLALLFLCAVQFAFWYGVHFADTPELRAFDIWDPINHENPERRILVRDDIAKIPGRLLVFVRYWPQHPFQEEWVYNGSDIDGQRVVWARDLGDAEDRKLIDYYHDRKVLLLEPDARPPQLEEYQAEPVEQAPQKEPEKKQTTPMLQLEQVR